MWTVVRALVILLAIHTFSIPGYCNDANDPWRSMKELPHDAVFVFVERDLTCHEGKIRAVSDKDVLLHSGNSDITIDKANLLRVWRGRRYYLAGPYMTEAVVYSGRSAWMDLSDFTKLMAERPHWSIRMSIITTGQKLYEGKLKSVTETDIILRDSSGKETSIPRTQVSRVDYIRSKPLSDEGEYQWHELAMLTIFDPQLYPRLFHIGDTMPVQLYDQTAPEDNTPVHCK